MLQIETFVTSLYDIGAIQHQATVNFWVQLILIKFKDVL